MRTGRSSLHPREWLVLLLPLLFSPSLTYSQNYYENKLDQASILSQINDTTEQICRLALKTGYSLKVNGTCKNRLCQATLTLERALPKGAVFVTTDFEVLFSKVDAEGSKEYEDSTILLPRSGLNVKFARRDGALLGADSGAKGLSQCYAKVGDILKTNFMSGSSRGDPFAVASGKDQITKVDRILRIDYASYTRRGPNVINLPESGTLVVEITPSQRYDFVKLEDNSTLIKKVDESLVKSINRVRSTPPSHGGIDMKFAFEQSSGTSLRKADPEFETLTLSLEIDGATVAPLTPIRQKIDPMRTARWIWQIDPKDDADLVRVRLQAFDPKADSRGSAPLYFDAFDIPISNPWHLRVYRFLSSNWQWIIGSLLTPIIALAWRRYRVSSTPPPHRSLKRKLAERQNRM